MNVRIHAKYMFNCTTQNCIEQGRPHGEYPFKGRNCMTPSSRSSKSKGIAWPEINSKLILVHHGGVKRMKRTKTQNGFILTDGYYKCM